MMNAARDQRAPDRPDWTGDRGADDDAPDLPDVQPVLDLAELMFDDNGEAVIFNDSNLRSLTLTAEAKVVGEGEAGPHVTAAGEDVSGFHYVAFDTGVKLFYQPGLTVIVGRRYG